ncbi:MAG: alpha/beta hydrolase [Pseudomonadota bacterium]
MHSNDPNAIPEYELDISYGVSTGTPKDLRLRLFRPNGRSRGTVIYAHGGGFSHGSRKDKTAAKLFARLVQDDVAVASIDYRKQTPIEAFGPTAAAQIIDAQSRSARVGLRINPQYCGPFFYAALEDFGLALGFLKKHQTELRLGGRFVALGASAGGIAALSLAFPPGRGWENLPRPDAAMGICAAMVQPWRLSPKGPPSVLLHGYHDGVIGPGNAKLAARRAAKKGAPLRTIITPIKGHRPQVTAFLEGNDETGRPYLDLLRDLLFNTSSPISSQG